MKNILILVSLALFSGFAALAQNPKMDKKLKKTLDKTGLTYSLDDDGDYRITMEVEKGRTHLIVLNARMDEYQGTFVCDMYGFAGLGDANEFRLSSSEYLELLDETGRTKIGGWGAYYSNDRTQVGFAYITKVTVSMTSDELAAHIYSLAVIADMKEEEWEKSGINGEVDKW